MSQILEGLDGVIDDILVFGKDQEEHDPRLEAVLQRLKTANVTLNREKCDFSKSHITFLGHYIDKDGICQDPKKTDAITKMKSPTSVPELRRFLGMANQLGKFSSNLAEFTKPLRELLSKESTWVWNDAQEQAFSKVKEELYNPLSPTKIAADASSYGLEA